MSLNVRNYQNYPEFHVKNPWLELHIVTVLITSKNTFNRFYRVFWIFPTGETVVKKVDGNKWKWSETRKGHPAKASLNNHLAQIEKNNI